MAAKKSNGTEEEGIDAGPQTVVTGSTADVWTETAFVSISPVGKGEITGEAYTDTIDMDDGESGVEFIPILNGGRLAKFTPKTENTITLEMYTMYGGALGWPAAATTKAVDGVYDLMQQEFTTTTDYFTLNMVSTTRAKIRLTVLWTNDTTTGVYAAGATAATKTAFRKSYADGYVTKIKQEFTDGVLKTTLTAKFPIADKSGNSCFLVQSTKGGSALVALNAYTGTTKF